MRVAGMPANAPDRPIRRTCHLKPKDDEMRRIQLAFILPSRPQKVNRNSLKIIDIFVRISVKGRKKTELFEKQFRF